VDGRSAGCGHDRDRVARGRGAGVIDISDERIDGNTITFQCRSPNGDNTITCAGTLRGSSITFAWKHEVRNGNALFSCCTNSNLFGPNPPPSFTAIRVEDEELAALADRVKGLALSAAANLVQRNVKVESTLFLLSSVNRIKAVVVANAVGLGTALYGDERFRSFAAQNQLAILLGRIEHINETFANTASGDAAEGGAQALIATLTQLATESAHPELSTIPLIFFGQSAGGSFGPKFGALHPQRTLAWVGYHSGGSGGGGARQAEIQVVKRIPGLLLAGAKDSAAALANMRRVCGRPGGH
jgi:hypothetical protein